MKICALILLINLTNQPWSSRDMKSFISSQQTCYKQYQTCLSKFVKKESNVFDVYCGDVRERQNIIHIDKRYIN